MSKLKHTPGPWEWEQTERVDTGLDVIIISEGAKGVGWVYNIDDARLISAAPEMLEYLVKQAKFEMLETDGVPGELADLIEKADGRKIELILKYK